MNRLIRFGRNMVSLGQPISFMKRRPAPQVLAIPLISKSVDPAVTGTVLTRVAGIYVDAVTVTWAWFSGSTQRQAGGATYTVVAGDVGTTITFKETATNPGGTTVTPTSGVPIS